MEECGKCYATESAAKKPLVLSDISVQFCVHVLLKTTTTPVTF